MITVCPNTGYQSRSSFTRTRAQRTPSSSAAPAEDAIEESDAT
jgi:hypothetical protein